MRYLWLTLGFGCVALGFVGIIVPGMPATGFFVAAAWCFSKSSDKFLHWLLNLPVVGPLVADYRAGRGMTRNVKWSASASLTLAVTLSAAFAIRMVWAKAGCVALGLIGLWYIWTCVPLRENTLSASSDSPE
jgi:uncharacterized protein